MFDKIKGLFTQEKEQKIDKFKVFIGLVDNYLRREHPNINFDCSIRNQLENEENLKVKKSLLIIEIVKQFVEFEYQRTTQKSVNKDMLWSGYGVNSLPNLRQPHDFSRRKELAFIRDGGICNRCGNKMDKVNKAFTTFAQEIKEGGGYNIENIIIICFNCYQVLNNQDKKTSDIALGLRDSLYDLV